MRNGTAEPHHRAVTFLLAKLGLAHVLVRLEEARLGLNSQLIETTRGIS